jgi:hypothetical protein
MLAETELDARLTGADRAAQLGAHAPSLAAAFTAAEPEARTRRRRRRFTAAGIATVLALALGASVPAAAGAVREFLAQTGTHCESGTECGTGATLAESEWIDSSQADFPEYVDSLFNPALPLAPGQSREQVVDWLVDSTLASDAAYGPGVWSSLGLSASLESGIYCGWIDEWLSADDDSARDRAAVVLREAATWPATVKSDGGGVVDYLLDTADAADRGETHAVRNAALGWACP